MTAELFKSLDDTLYKAWYNAQPEAIRKLATEFPPGSELLTAERDLFYVIGYASQNRLFITVVNPYANYELAINNRTAIDADFIRDNFTKQTAKGSS